MSFLSSIFKKKPGGTFVGNLIRGAVKAVPIVGGALGNGGNMIPAGSTDGLTNNQLAALANKPVQTTGQTIANAAVQVGLASPAGDAAVKNAFLEKLKQWWWIALIPFGMIILFFILRKSSNQSAYSRRNRF